AARYYQHVFKPQLIRKLIAIAGENAPLKKQKAAYHKLICKKFYEIMKAEKGTTSAAQKKKISSGVAKILKKNSIPETLALVGAKKAASALKKKDAATKKAATDVTAKEKPAKEARRKADSVIKRVLAANVKAKKLEKEAAN
ncbi:unnamed protein product, partial [Laminaria digitata]